MPRVLAGRYALDGELATGGFAKVYRGTDRRLHRPVAVKVLDARRVATADPAAMRRFVREARTSAAFSHAHAVTVFDAGEVDGELFLVMELVDGPSLAAVLADEGALPEDRAVRIAIQLLSALGAAHASGIVHRDVKPANVLLDARGNAKLADFGIAKRFDDLTDSLTVAGLIVGTPRYLAPEQARGEPLSPATDIYAVGVILHEMIAGAPPFEDDSVAATAGRDGVPVPRLDVVRPGTSQAVADAVATALAPDPADRFHSATAMLAALRGERAAPALAATTAMAAAGVATAPRPVAPTQVMPRSGTNPRRRALAIFAGLCIAGIAAVALAARDEPGDGDLAGATDATTTGAGDIALTAPATTTISPTTVATTTSTTTTTTTAPTTTVSPTTVRSTVAALVPGFPMPDDLETFLAQLRDDPEVIGPHGDEIENALDRLLGENSRRKRSDRAAGLIRDVSDWRKEGTIDPAVADVLTALLDPLADQANGDDDGDD